MITMTSHIERCGATLGKSVKHFNQFIGSLEQSVMPQVRRFNELEVEGTAAEVPVLEPVELEPRVLRSDRDFQRALSQGSKGLSGRRLIAALYAFSSTLGVCAAGFSAFC
jgi:DNA anti-recombination protein RmuC